MSNNDIVYNLTNPQKSIWLTEQFYSNTPINNICGSLIIRQATDIKLLEKAINRFIENNDSFKLRFKILNDEPVQYFVDDTYYTFDVVDLNSESDIEPIANKMVDIPFQIENSKLFDFKLFKLSNGFGGFIVNVHHIISDAATFSLIGTEVVDIYSKLVNNQDIPAKTYSYLDYISSEKEYLSSDRFKKDKDFWNEKLTPLPEVASIPYQNNESKLGIADRTELVFDNTYMDKIKNYCQENKISLYNFLVSIYSLYIGRVSNLDNFLIGTPILNRTNYKEKNTSGMFISTSLLNISLDNNSNFVDFSKSISAICMSMLKHQKYNYQCIIEDIRNTHNSISNLYDIILSYQITKATNINSDIKYDTKWYGTKYIANSLSIHFHDNNDTGNLLVEYDYQIAKYSKQDMIDIHNRIITIINQVLSNSVPSIKDIEIVASEERHKLIYDFNHTSTDYPKDKTIIQLFTDQVNKNPKGIALFFEGKKITYSELDLLSNNLANYLLTLNIQYEDRIAIFLDKSVEMIISILAILKVNAAFVPIDIEYPKERIEYILSDANAKVVLTTKNLHIDIFKNLSVVHLDTNFDCPENIAFNYTPKSNTSLAYVMYTSGSTGKPKGVMIEQQNIIRLVKNPNYIKFHKKERILQTGSIVFDACTFEIWAALLNGFQLYILKKENLLNPAFLSNYLIKNRITILWLTSPLFNQLSDINPYMFGNIRYLLTGGDVLSTKHINKVMEANPDLHIINGYGPTENTTFSCCFNIDKKYTNSIPIGGPISGSTCYVVSPFGKLQPIGVPGELYVGGDGVGRGYLNRPDLTSEKFIDNPFSDGRMYKTGDLVKWLPNGNIEFIGRIDSQVKIRGFRVELNEINNTILSYPHIKNSVTVVQNISNSKTICSYVIPNGNLDINNLKIYLRKILPNYMIPQYFIIMGELPITINGKVNKSMLPIPTIEEKSDHKKAILPSSDTEKIIYDFIKKIRPNDSISINDNFFIDICMDSLNAMQLCASLYDYNVTIQDISDYPTIKLLAEKIDKNSHMSLFENTLPDILVKNNTVNFDLSSVLLTGALGFLGMHILEELLNTPEVKNIYCLVRDKSGISYDKRFNDALFYYFGNDLNDLVKQKVILVNGDFDNIRFGLDVNLYTKLSTDITTVIHAGANVKHYGNFQKFNTSNVIGTKHVIEFCRLSHASLAHISTISVSGYCEINEKLCLTENSFNIGQSFNNHVYMITKYLAEYYVLKAINNKEIDAKIFRLGNIMPRLRDNIFQNNIKDNALISRLNTISCINQLTDYYQNAKIDFSPVDLCAKAIITLIKSNDCQTIYHVFNNNTIYIKDFLNMSEIPYKIVLENEFIDSVKKLNDPLAFHLLNDLKHENYIETPVDNDLTTSILLENNFHWNKISQNYTTNIRKLLEN